MSLFFFISGYFSPTSCDRKGVKLFLKDKFKRLGVPFIVYTFILGPSLDAAIHYKFVSSTDTWVYLPNWGPCWFLAWLLIFNSCYVLIDSQQPNWMQALPSLTRLMFYGALLGVLQLGAVLLLLADGYMFMPITFGSLPFDIVLFTAGVVAKRNDWLTLLVEMRTTLVTLLGLAYIVMWLGFVSYIYVSDLGWLIPKKDAFKNCDDESSGDAMAWQMYVAFGCMFVVAGSGCMLMSMWALQLSARYANYASGVTRFFSEQAYCVYLIHPLVLCPVAYSFVVMQQYLFDGPKVEFCSGDVTSFTQFDGDYVVWLGWAYTLVLTVAIVWPLSWCIRQIPGFKTVI